MRPLTPLEIDAVYGGRVFFTLDHAEPLDPINDGLTPDHPALPKPTSPHAKRDWVDSRSRAIQLYR